MFHKVIVTEVVRVSFSPSSNVKTSLHLFTPSVALKLSTKLVLFSSQQTSGSDACLLHLDCSPMSANQALAFGSTLSMTSIAFLNMNFDDALAALQNIA